jgi:ubiquitin carboxyl-terminal hydrolase 25
MSKPPSGPGKLSPKLVQDLFAFDPNKASVTHNYLTHLTPPVGEGQQLGPGIGSCKHEYATKHPQSVLPPLDHRAVAGEQFKCAMLCKKCRLHCTVRLDYGRAVECCPSEGWPLHHWVYEVEREYATTTQIGESWIIS